MQSRRWGDEGGDAMFERFTESARLALFLARYEASHFGATQIDTEHLLLGIVRENKLADLGEPVASLTYAAVWEELKDRKGSDFTATYVEIPFSIGTRRVLESAATESSSMGHGFIGTEHLLLALLSQPQSVAAETLARHGITEDALRNAVVLGARPDRPGAPQPHALAAFGTRIQEIKHHVDHLAVVERGTEEADALVKTIHAKLDLLLGP